MDGGLTRWALESMLTLLKGKRSQRQPLNRQAARLLDAFTAHGVPPHQLPRLMPEAIRLKPQDLVKPEALAAQLRLEHLDWTHEILALRRDWLDLESEQPHQEVHAYKRPDVFYRWLLERAAVRAGLFGAMHVLTDSPFAEPGVASGRFVAIYEECFAQLDDKALSRFWYLSNGMNFEHTPCTVDLLGMLTIAEDCHLTLSAHTVSAATLHAAESGKLGLLPPILAHAKRWHIQDWVPIRYETQNCHTETHRALWEATREKLISHGLSQLLAR